MPQPTEEHLRQLDAGPKSLEDKELYAAQRRLDAGPLHPDAAPAPEAPSKEIPKDHIQENALLVPAVVRRELYDLAELLVEVAWYQDDELQVFERKARALVDKILGVGIEHYRRLTSAADDTFAELDRQRDELLQAIQEKAPSKETPGGEDGAPALFTDLATELYGPGHWVKGDASKK